MSHSLRPHRLQSARLPYPSLFPRVCSDSCPLSQWCYPTISTFDPPPPASIRVFFSESALSIRWPRNWNFSFSISPSNKYSELISFRIDWFDFLAVQGTLKSLIQHHNWKVSILQHLAFFMVQLSYLYMITGKTTPLTMWTLLAMMSLLFNMLSRFVIAFLPSSKYLLIWWLQSLPTVILEPKKRKYVIASTFSPSICNEVMGPDVVMFIFWMLIFKPAFSLSNFTLIKSLFNSFSLSALEWYHLHIWGCWYFSLQSWFQLVLHLALHFSWCALHIS